MQNSDENVIHLSLTAISSLIMVIYPLFSTVATIMCCSSVFKSLLFAKHRFNFEAAIFGKLFMKMFISPLWICLVDFGLIEVFIWSAFYPLWGFKPILIRIPGSVELPTMYFTSSHYWQPCFREITLICFGAKHHRTLVLWEITVLNNECVAVISFTENMIILMSNLTTHVLLLTLSLSAAWCMTSPLSTISIRVGT